jgi:hypothetical protein
MVLVDPGEGVCVICLVFRVFFLKKGCVLYPQMNFKSFFDRKKILEKYFVSKHSGVGC